MAVLKRPGYPASCDIGMDQKRSYDLPYFFGTFWVVQETVELNLFVPEDAKAKDVEARGMD